MFSMKPQSIQEAQKFQGTWNSTYGQLRLVAYNNIVYGDYADTGVFYGGMQIKNGKYFLNGVFENYNLNKKGVFEFEITNPNKFDGYWTWDTSINWTAWTGTKNSSDKPNLDKFFRVILHHYSENGSLMNSKNKIVVLQDGLVRFIFHAKDGKYDFELPKGTWELKLLTVSNNELAKTTLVVDTKYPGNNSYYKVNLFEKKSRKY
ncbi:MAG: hypothetical protein CVU03_00280 [Bacteroidetes bacterium HGW-Bacteroidetes-2]|nr:MAG: hypothetical protein CVU03_00280 [Bacteroidetes bacterium HGW-Bacteroidetes-2]